MKKITVLIILLTSMCFSIAQTSKPVVEDEIGFDKLTFQVELDKEQYLPLEPIVVKFTLSNQTKTTVKADRPDFLRHSTLQVTDPKGNTKEITSLSLSSGGGPALPGPVARLQPLQSYEEEAIPMIDPAIFEKPGCYRLQFFLKGLKSSLVEISVEQPAGIDKEALDFLRQHGNDVRFGKVFSNEADAGLIKIFVERYAGSVYGDYAVQSLGRYYLYNKELEKAKKEFEKLKNSKIKTLSQQSKNDLADIEKKMKEKQN